MARVKFGIEWLDNMMSGGLPENKVYFLMGDSGTGKTLFSLKFLYEGLRMGEKCLYISTDRPPYDILNPITESFGWNFLSLNVMDAVPSPSLYTTGAGVRDMTAKGEIRDLSTANKKMEKGELTFESLQLKMELEFKERKFNRVVMDSFTTLKRFGADPETRNPVMAKFVRFFVEKGVTALFTDEGNLDNVKPELVLAGGVILLRRTIKRNMDERTLQIIKMRGTIFDPEIKVFKISDNGFELVQRGKK
ncbi:MAG: RAD55 family ATPase [Thermoplasmata archaeon]